MKVTTPLWEHQDHMVDRAYSSLAERGYFFLNAIMASGKTLAVLKLIELLDSKSVLVVTVKSGIPVWAREAAKHAVGVEVISRNKSSDNTQKVTQYWNDCLSATHRHDRATIYVINYESAARMKKLNFAAFDFVILDESHKVQSHDGMISTTLARRCASIRYKLVMTGTPYHDRPLSVWGQVRFLTPIDRGAQYIDSDILGRYWKFFEQYTIYRTLDNIKIPIGYKNLDKLTRVLAPFMMTVQKKDLQVTMPKQLMIDIPLSLEGDAATYYKTMLRDSVVTTKDKSAAAVAENPLVKSTYLRMILSGLLRVRDVITNKEAELTFTTPRLEAILDLLEGLPDNEPLVIYTAYKYDIRLLTNVLNQRGYTTAEITGEKNTLDLWTKETTPHQVLLVNIDAGSASIDLTRACYVVYYSVGYSNTNYEQSLARCVRPSSMHETVSIYRLIIKDTIDELIYRALDEKMDVQKTITRSLEAL
jgi:SNF2 family DNA or RNA helicase